MAKQKSSIDIDGHYGCVSGFENYIAATANGAVRLSPDSPKKIAGLATANIKVCYGVVIYNNERASLIHHHTKKTDFSSYSEELQWVGNQENTKVIIAKNKKFYDDNFFQCFNMDAELEELEQMIKDIGVGSSQISHLEANNGAIFFSRQKCAVEAYKLELEPELFLGKPFPYITLRRKVNDLSGGKVVDNKKSKAALDVQHDGVRWTKLPSINNCIISDKDAAKIGKLYLSRQQDKAVEFLESLDTVKLLKKHPGAFRAAHEFPNWLKAKIVACCEYYVAMDRYAKHKSTFTYKMFSCNAEQQNLIEAVGGRVLEVKDRDMFVAEIPSKLMTKDIREELGIARVRMTQRLDIDLPIGAALSRHIKGWRAEKDFSQKDAILITFPWSSRAEREVKKTKISEINKQFISR